MSVKVLSADDCFEWRKVLKLFAKVDVCQSPEYHNAYLTRERQSQALLWFFQRGENYFAYPFLLTPVCISGKKGELEKTPYKDISSVYGYSGPLSTTQDTNFLQEAWQEFDQWCRENQIIAEFTRYSIFAKTHLNAHPRTTVAPNRLAAVSYLPKAENDLLSGLNSKTRNMVRKAEKYGFVSEVLEPQKWIKNFKNLYIETMGRNQAPHFFLYDDKYFDLLLSLPEEEISLHGVFFDNKLVSAAIALMNEKSALYHLGASLPEYSKLGAGNLTLYDMGRFLISKKVEFLNLGGGRTTSESDSLFLFKRNNASSVETFYIGKRIVDENIYSEVKRKWRAIHDNEDESQQLIFYR